MQTLNILEMLTVVDELSTSEIHKKYQSSPQAISQHLKILRKADLVHVEKGLNNVFIVNTDTMNKFDEWIKSMMHLNVL